MDDTTRASDGAPRPSKPSKLHLQPAARSPRRVEVRLLVDVIALALGTTLGLLGPWHQHALSDETRIMLWALPFLSILILYLRGHYRRRMRWVLLDELVAVIAGLSAAAMTLIVATLTTGTADSPGEAVAPVWVAAGAMAVAGRVTWSKVQRQRRLNGRSNVPALVVGAGLIGSHIVRRLQEHREYGLDPVGFLDSNPLSTLAPAKGFPPVLGSPEQLEQISKRHGVRHVIIAFTTESDRSLIGLVRRCRALDIEVSLVPRLFDFHNERVALEHLGGLPLNTLHSVDPRGRAFAAKHALDRVAAALGLLLLGPLMLAIATAVKLGSFGPVLFLQQRVGRDGQPFDLLKFCSMREVQDDQRYTPDAGSAPGGVEGTDRRTAIGRWLRRTSLDELPQLINVLRGDMSLIGPRPERVEFVDLFQRDFERYNERHRVKAGITGWAQVHGLRGQTSLADRVEWDNFYIDNWSLALDLRITLMTIRELLFGSREPR
jgi:exopolysaccharide biosynthesis polyprenyl glycosylphosphotransferase